MPRQIRCLYFCVISFFCQGTAQAVEHCCGGDCQKSQLPAPTCQQGCGESQDAGAGTEGGLRLEDKQQGRRNTQDDAGGQCQYADTAAASHLAGVIFPDSGQSPATCGKLQIERIRSGEGGQVVSDGELIITYTLTNDGWGTICLPFEDEIPDGMIAYTITGISETTLVVEEADFFQMNTPYLVSGTPGTYSFHGPDTPGGSNWENGLLVGVTAKKEEYLADADFLNGYGVYAPRDSYVFRKEAEELGFHWVEFDNTKVVLQYTAYLELPNGGPGFFPIPGSLQFE